MRTLLALGSLLGYLLGASLAFAGAMTSSGGELITTERNPWFVGAAPVSYCIEQAGAFSPAADDVRAAVRRSLAEWTDALARMRPVAMPEPLPDGERKNLSLTFVEEPCRSTTALHFRLGVLDAEIRAVLAQHSRYTLAFAMQDGIDERTGRASRGIIWLAADIGTDAYRGPVVDDAGFWRHEPILHGVLLHELGHMFGFRHDDGPSFMHENYPAQRAAQMRAPYPRTLDDYVALLWQRHRTRRCSEMQADDRLVQRIFGATSPGNAWRACLEPEADPLFLEKLQVILYNDQGDRVGAGEFTAKLGSVTNLEDWNGQAIGGRYVSQGSGLALYHDFVRIPRSVSLRGSLQVGARRWPALLDQRDFDLSLTVIEGSGPDDYGSFWIGP